MSTLSKTKNWTPIREHIYKNAYGQEVAVKRVFSVSESDEKKATKTAVWYRIERGKALKGLTSEIKAQIPLYHIPQLLQAINQNRAMNDEPLFFTEGEKDTETLEKMGFIATTGRNGGGAFPKYAEIEQYVNPFNYIFILADNDDTGKKYGVNGLNQLSHINNGLNKETIFIIDTLEIFMQIPENTRKDDILQEHNDISDLTEKYGIDITKQALVDVMNARHRFGNQEFYVNIVKSLIEEKQPKSQKEEKDTRTQAERLLPFLTKEKITYKNDRLYIYQDGIYKILNMSAFLAPHLNVNEVLRKTTLDDLQTTMVSLSSLFECQIFKNLICLENNVYDILTGTKEPHNPRFFFTYKLPEIGDFQKVKEFLSCFVDNEEKIGYFLGSTMFAHNLYGKALFLVGKPKTGKSTIMTCIEKIFDKAVTHVDFTKKYQGRWDFFNIVDSPLNTNDDVVISNLTGVWYQGLITGSNLQAERKFGEVFNFDPITKLMFTMNYAPVFTHESEGMQRRSLVVYTKHVNTIPEVPPLADWLAYAIFYARLLANCNFKKEFETVDVINDTLDDFLETLIFPVQASELYEKYVDFCKRNNDKNPLSKHIFYDLLHEKGYCQERAYINNNQVRVWNLE